ncbi:endonuclease MutS2 [Sediminitomix flava]|uniref:Endonuclease MutS2 n=1 Tax=Sediminitomix flava TaxID=379075 RepID=A0A315ZA57_SEDFL|nr:endonuclease MutS2 [Sediminitomix flava]PWJ42465.1 DNA mismatch repair protein MutS2 [Sediminitomix flava]
MLYPRNLEEKLGFDQIRSYLIEKCNGAVGKSYVERIKFTNNAEVIRKHNQQVSEYLYILSEGANFPASNFIDIYSFLKKAQVEGTFFTEEEAYDLKRAFTTLNACLSFFRTRKEEEFPELYKLAAQIDFPAWLLREFERVIDDRGKVSNSASAELQRIRARIAQISSSLRQKMDSILKDLKGKGMVKEDALQTMREGRMVIPVVAEHKKHVKGFVHDASATGQTIFIEPETVLNANNEIKDLALKERQEIVRILTALTDQVRPYISDLMRSNNFLGMIDFIRSKALLAQEMEAIMPDAIDEPHVEWYNVKHPLLILHHKKLEKEVIPQNIRLDHERGRMLLISGPNAGGKSVAMKTVGLVQYMYQCGLLVPMVEGSRMGIFDDIFMDYGDDQSLENDLSTYSSHLTNMRHFLKKSGEKSLCLIDEFGAGTEPELGGAIAEAILEQLNRQQAWGVITTHYANLKFYADKYDGLQNGAMRYDVENLQPLYKLEQGQPGSSFALEIAGKIGLPKKVVNIARHKAGRKKISMEELLRDLENEKKVLTEKTRELKHKENKLKQQLEKYERLTQRIEERREKLIDKAKREANTILDDANRQIELTIKEIREGKAEKEKTKKLREELGKYKDKVKVGQEQKEPKEVIEVISGEIKLGDYVRIKGQETIGEVMEIKNNDIRVAMGALQSNIKRNRLERVSRKEFRKENKQKDRYSTLSASSNMNTKHIEFSPNLDLRGKRAEEVMGVLDDFLDTAIMLSHGTELRIVHGKGTGALREVVRNHLKNFSGIKSVSDEHPDRGGAGVTLVRLR